MDQLQYRSLRSAVILPDPASIPLERLGPQVTLSVFAQNNRQSSTGSVFPRSTFYVYLPLELLSEGTEEEGAGSESQGSRPLLAPVSVVVGDRNVNCSQFQAIPQGLVRTQLSLAVCLFLLVVVFMLFLVAANFICCCCCCAVSCPAALLVPAPLGGDSPSSQP